MNPASEDTDTAVMGPVAVDGAVRQEIVAFLYLEARLADESRYEEWEALWADADIHYWVPRGEGVFDPARQVSITSDNRSRLANRIRQLKTGARHSQCPVSPMRRLISNIELYALDDGVFRVEYNFALYELRIQSTGQLQVWPGRMEFHLRRHEGRLRMHYKRVSLVNGAAPVPSISFIL